MHVPLRRALLSVADKRGLVPLAQALVAQGVTLISTGGTARTPAASQPDFSGILSKYSKGPTSIVSISRMPK